MENIAQIMAIISVDYLAFDFRHTSNRYIGELDEALLSKIDHKIHKIAIFDNHSPLYMSYITGRFALNGAQINGNVPVKTCEILAAEGLEVIKVINSVADIDKYEGVCNSFLFEDKKIFEKYNGKTPSIVKNDIYCGQSNVYTVDTCEDFEFKLAFKDYTQIEDWYKNIV